MTTTIGSERSFWLPINSWNLNELFTSESISPISFYAERDFGNPVNRNQEKIEDINNLILFNKAVQSDSIIEILPPLLDLAFLSEIKSKKNTKLKSFEYSKTIYLRRGMFKIYFNSQKKLNEFLNNTFMLLEVKMVGKYKADFIVDEHISKTPPFYQTKLISQKSAIQPFYDKAFNQIKGLLYGYLIGSIGALGENEQQLVSELSKLKNSVGSVHTDILLSEQYSNFWLVNVRKQMESCKKTYHKNFDDAPTIFDTLLLRLEEIDHLNQMRCSDLERQKSIDYRRDYENEQEKLEKAKRKLYAYEFKNGIVPIMDEFEEIKLEEKIKGKSKGRTREFYKKGTEKYDRKKELKQLIADFEQDEQYQQLKSEVGSQAEKLKNYQFGFTQYDTSLTEQFGRVSEQLHTFTKKLTNSFLSKNKSTTTFPDISFAIDIQKLTNYYSSFKIEYNDFGVRFPADVLENLTSSELNLLSVTLNSLLSQPQGRLGNFSEQNALEIIKSIGEHLPEGSDKQTLREYYLYRIGKNESFTFPENPVMANIVVFLMKLHGHEQINKMLVSKNVLNKHFAYMFYGAYCGFANLPKTFTNVVLDSDNFELLDYVDSQLFNRYLN